MPVLPQAVGSHSQRHGAVHKARALGSGKVSQLPLWVEERYTQASILSLDLTAALSEAEAQGLVCPLHALTDVLTS